MDRPRALPSLLLLLLVVAGAGCGGEAGGSCGLEDGRWSVANAGGLCQANFFGDVEYAVYCSANADGEYDCACGAASEAPREFVSADFCDLEGEARACEAIARCDFPL